MKILSVNKTDVIKGWPWHHHPIWELVITVVGTEMVETAREQFHASVGSAYLVPPGISHMLHSQDVFQEVFVFCDSLPFPEDRITGVDNIDGLPGLATLLLNLHMKRQEGYYDAAEKLLQFIVQLLQDSLREREHNPLSLRVRDYIVEKYADPSLNMESIAEHLQYQTDYIRRCFREDFSMTPLEYLNELRMDQAKRLLREMPDYSVGQVSNLCGFNDPFYFSRLFKKKVGMSPRAYRNRDGHILGGT